MGRGEFSLLDGGKKLADTATNRHLPIKTTRTPKEYLCRISFGNTTKFTPQVNYDEPNIARDVLLYEDGLVLSCDVVKVGQVKALHGTQVSR